MLFQDLFIIILYYMYYEYGSQLYDFVVSLGLVRSSLSVRLGGVSLYSFGRVNVCPHQDDHKCIQVHRLQFDRDEYSLVIS